jgi:hypothetical protein
MKKQVIFARMREAYSPGFFPFILQPGELLPVDISNSILSKKTEWNLMKRDIFGITSFTVPKDLCTCVFKVMESQFEIGQIVIKKGSEFAFRICSITWDRVDFWFADGWGVAQNLASGALQSDVRLATEEEISKSLAYITYYDGLIRKRELVSQDCIIESKINDNDINT